MRKRCTHAEKMKKAIIILIISTIGFSSCKQGSKSTPDTVEKETYNSVRNYEYADSMGNRLIIRNSFPKGGMKYTDSDGEVYGYVVFWTQITDETINPVELKIDFPLDSFEFPSSSGRYQKLLLPSDTMTIDKAPLSGYGLNVKSFLDNHRFEASSLKRTINPKDSTAFHVVIFSKWKSIAGGRGSMRTALTLKGQNLIYKIFAYKMTHDLPLMDKIEINCGSINLKNLVLRE
jgi:hypothetical protein